MAPLNHHIITTACGLNTGDSGGRKTTMMGDLAAVLLMFAICTGFAKVSVESVRLDLACDAVDDMYSGCKGKMDNRVRKLYLPYEKNRDKNFKLAWGEVEKYYKKKWKRRKGTEPSSGLSKEQIMAIYVYTLDKPNVHLDFNNAVRSNRRVYLTKFRYHALHFFLTDALQTLNSRKPKAKRCVTGYRRTNVYFGQDSLNKEIRFGSFTSSSTGWYPSAYLFGRKSCFEIVTCFGADISRFSKFEAEREVLIPPYEVFKVAGIDRRSDGKDLPCDVVYKLRSTGKTLSNLNCALFAKNVNKMRIFLKYCSLCWGWCSSG